MENTKKMDYMVVIVFNLFIENPNFSLIKICSISHCITIILVV